MEENKEPNQRRQVEMIGEILENNFIAKQYEIINNHKIKWAGNQTN